MKWLYAAVITAAMISGPCHAIAQTASDEELAWVTDQDDNFFYLAYTIPESDRFAVAFVCHFKDKKTYLVLHEKQGGTVKAGDKFGITLQIGDVKTTVQAETTFDASEEMLRSVGPVELNDPIFARFGSGKPLQLTRADQTMSFPLTDASDRLNEFRKGCGLKK